MDSTFFRVMIAISGLLFIAGLLLWEWVHKRALNKTEALLRQQRQQEFNDQAVEIEGLKVEVPDSELEKLELPSIKAERTETNIDVDVANSQSETPVEKVDAPSVIQIAVISKTEAQFEGNSVRVALEAVGLSQGDMGIYHRHFDPQGEDRFSVANLVEPGSFPSDRNEPFTTPGIVIFLEVGLQKNPLVVFDTMLQTGKQLEKLLNGTLLDEKHQPFGAESLPNMREQLAAL